MTVYGDRQRVVEHAARLLPGSATQRLIFGDLGAPDTLLGAARPTSRWRDARSKVTPDGKAP
jgi:hypothetical protein